MTTTNLTATEILSQLRITPATQVHKREFLFSWRNTPCFPRGELVALTGKAKSGKTYMCSILMALAQLPECMGLTRIRNEPYKVLWLDTEQSEDSTQEILCDRVGALIHDAIDDERFFAYNLRTLNWQERLQKAEWAICATSPDLIIFDGIRDVMGDINDYCQAQEVLEQLLSITSHFHACMVCVLHQNKAVEDKTLRGAIGTELQNKSFETYECTKDETTHLFSVKQTATRKYDISTKLRFVIDAQGLPQPQCFPDDNAICPQSRSPTREIFNPDYMSGGRLDLPKLFAYLLPNGKYMSMEQLRAAMMRVAHIRSFSFAGNIIQEALTRRLLFPVQDEQGNTFYQLEQTIF